MKSLCVKFVLSACIVCAIAPAADAQTRRPRATASAPATSTAPATAPVVVQKFPAPTADQLKESLKIISDIFKNDIATAKTPEQKKSLLEKMMQAAAEEKDHASCYALLERSRELAVEYAAVDAACGLVATLDEGFEIDAVKLLADTLTGLLKTVRAADDQRVLVSYAVICSERANAADRYDISKQAIDAAVAAARLTNDSILQRDITQRGTRLRELELGYADCKKAMAVLVDSPKDPEANLKAGKYFCLVKGDWPRGMPMLALGSDAPLKALAAADIAGVIDADAQVKLADDWWDLGEKNTGMAQFRIRSHAGTWYKTALPNLAGLSKVKAERRIAQVESDQLKFLEKGLVNLIALVKPERDFIAGKWELKDRAIVSSNEWTCRMQFNYRPPEEYDYRVDFTRVEGGDGITLVLTNGKKNFMFQAGGWRNTVLGFELVAGQRSRDNPSTVKAGLETGKKYELIIKVRKTGLEAYLNGKLATSLKTDYANLTEAEEYGINDKAAVGLCTYSSRYLISRVEINEVSARGSVVTTAPAPK